MSRPRQNNFLFGLPFDLFNDGSLKENTRPQRRIPIQPTVSAYDPYVSSNGIPLYRYRKKHPHGYGRKKREAQK